MRDSTKASIRALMVMPTRNETDNLESIVRKIVERPGLGTLVVDDDSAVEPVRWPTGSRGSQGILVPCRVAVRGACDRLPDFRRADQFCRASGPSLEAVRRVLVESLLTPWRLLARRVFLGGRRGANR
jgi:hypothetical protein